MAVKTNCVKNGVPYFRIHRKINGKYEDFYGKNKSDAEEQYYERKKEAEIGNTNKRCNHKNFIT